MEAIAPAVSTRRLRQAATADVEISLDVNPGVPHVFQASSGLLDEAGAALDTAGQRLSSYSSGVERIAG